MRWLAVALLLGVFAANDSAFLLAGRFTPPAIFYMLQGVWVALLSSVLLMVFLTAQKSIWRSLGVAAMVISIIEAMEIPVCRFFLTGPVHGSVCDTVTGLPVSAVTVCLELFILAWMVGSHRE